MLDIFTKAQIEAVNRIVEKKVQATLKENG